MAKSDVKGWDKRWVALCLKWMMFKRFWDWSIVSIVIFDGVSVDLMLGLLKIWFKVKLIKVESKDRFDDILF